MAHITGGGIQGNLSRIIPDGLSARINLKRIVVPPVFKYIKSNGNVAENEMLRTFNCGVGLVIVVEAQAETIISKAISNFYECYPIGEVVKDSASVEFENNLNW